MKRKLLFGQGRCQLLKTYGQFVESWYEQIGLMVTFMLILHWTQSCVRPCFVVHKKWRGWFYVWQELVPTCITDWKVAFLILSVKYICCPVSVYFSLAWFTGLFTVAESLTLIGGVNVSWTTKLCVTKIKDTTPQKSIIKHESGTFLILFNVQVLLCVFMNRVSGSVLKCVHEMWIACLLCFVTNNHNAFWKVILMVMSKYCVDHVALSYSNIANHSVPWSKWS